MKIGYTERDVEQRVREQYPIKRPGTLPYRIEFSELAMREDGSCITDRELHRHLKARGYENTAGEWFRCTVDELQAAYIEVKTRRIFDNLRSQDFEMRPEQADAVNLTQSYFQKCQDRGEVAPYRFLWNAKMRFGKTFATYKLAQKMGWKRVLVLTFKPAVQNAWETDIKYHKDFHSWQFISRDGLSYESANQSKPFVCFGSFQDYLGKNPDTGGIKPKNEWVHCINWDCVVLDEYHYGSWRDRAQELFESEENAEKNFAEGAGLSNFDEDILPITTDHYLYLSGTPFRAINTGEFIEEQIFNWTYSDEQQAKASWRGKNNPYASLPRMVLMTYQLPDSVVKIARQGEFNEFDLNSFFSTEGKRDQAQFIHKNEVQKWLNWIRGDLVETAIDDLKIGNRKPPLPFRDSRLLSVLNHTFWFLPSIASCHAMSNLLKERHNKFFHDYEIIVAAGNSAGIGVKALDNVHQAMASDPLKTKSITLSCGKLTTGVTVRPWTGIFILRNLSSPETYFQAAFRVQSPWTVKNSDGKSPNEEIVIKEECYVFDFAPNRALRQIAEYSCSLNYQETNPVKKVSDFIDFLPVLAFDGSSMVQINAEGILDAATSGTTVTLLVRKWESALLVNVDDSTLNRLQSDPDLLEALKKIEGFRGLNQTISTIVNVSGDIKNTKKNRTELTEREKKELTEKERELKRLRKTVREKLVKFATRIPIFMYLTDYREHTLKDVITKLEPGLFRKVTGLAISDFEGLVSLGVFNSSLMNDAVYKFKRYEDASLAYTGIDRHLGQEIGLYDTTTRQGEIELDEIIEVREENDR